MDPLDPLGLEEYRQLRATIRERVSLKLILFVVTLVTWAIVASLVAALLSLPLASLLSLILLMSGFETLNVLHIGVERIGRYLFVNYESVGAAPAGPAPGGPGPSPRLHWEGAIAAFAHGHRPSTRPADALFSLIFAAAIAVNLLIASLGATAPELIGVGAVHALALVRVLVAKRAAAGQREEDEARFRQVLS